MQMRNKERKVQECPANTEVQEGGGGWGAAGTRVEILPHPMEDQSRADIHTEAQRWPCTTPDVLWKNRDLWRTHAEAGFPDRQWRWPMLKQFRNNCSLWKGPVLAQKKIAWRKSCRKELYFWSATSYLTSSCAAQGDKRVGKGRSEIESGKRREEENILGFVFVSHHPTQFLLGNKLFFPVLSLFCAWH